MKIIYFLVFAVCVQVWLFYSDIKVLYDQFQNNIVVMSEHEEKLRQQDVIRQLEKQNNWER